jgi:hypothetical protein
MCAAYVLEDLLGLCFAMLALFLDDDNVVLVGAAYVVLLSLTLLDGAGKGKVIR